MAVVAWLVSPGMDDLELRTLILETARDLPHDGGLTAVQVAEAVLDSLTPQQAEAVVAQVFEWYVQDAVDAALDILKARLN